VDVSIYIDVYHTGHLLKGTGTYAIVLEYIKSNGIPVTREYIQGISGTTKNRAALYACIKAFQELIKECNVKVIINSEYIIQAINTNAWIEWIRSGRNAKKKLVKNLELWKQLYELIERHNVEFEYAEKNSYSVWMQSEVKRREIVYKEDQNHV
jgi:ribonuclease HI